MILGYAVSGVCEVVGAFLRGEGVEELADRGRDRRDGSRREFAQAMFELSKDLFDGVQVGRVFGQEDQLRPGSADDLPHVLPLVATEIVHDHDLVGLQGRSEDLLDVSPEARAVDRAVEDPWSVDAVVAQRRYEGQGFPLTVRNLGFEPLAARCPTPQRRHVGLRPGLIQKHQAPGIDAALILGPLRPPPRYVGTILFAGDHGFF